MRKTGVARLGGTDAEAAQLMVYVRRGVPDMYVVVLYIRRLVSGGMFFSEFAH